MNAAIHHRLPFCRAAALWMLLALFAACAPPRPPAATAEPPSIDDSPSDSALQFAAAESLGQLEGTVLVLNPQDGRLRAVINPRLAFEQAFPPGSAIKPFTALTAFRAGLVDRETRAACPGFYEHPDFRISCSHPKSRAPLTFAQALGYSCNYYFAHLSERLNMDDFASLLGTFGFGQRTGVNAGGESQGRLALGRSQVKAALGESDGLLVTPIQLVMAYSALVNGGHLYRPMALPARDFKPVEVRSVSLAPAHRAALLEGMRGAVKYGTAAPAKLNEVPLDVFGKTGTSTASNGFRTQGWFVGFAAEPGTKAKPEAVKLVVLVLLKRAHGAQGAEVARPIFAAYARTLTARGAAVAKASPEESPSASPSLPSVKVHLTRAQTTRTLRLEEYVRGVLAAESSVESEAEALKAQAIVSRTFALRNLGRHRREGYDFCDLTHCQRYLAQVAPSHSEQRERAVLETSGQVVSDGQGALADVYFHASCGGRTASLKDVWGAPAPSYLGGVSDEFCATLPHRKWTQTISVAQLTAALRGDERSDPGPRLRQIAVTERDASGRAEAVRLEGEHRRLVRGWDFALIVNRALGWNQIKSARFEVRRSGNDFIFRGSGLGHGLGLCQEGAHILARRGADYGAILEHYFPGAKLKSLQLEPRESAVFATPYFQSSITASPASFRRKRSDQSPQRLLSSEHFRLSLPAQVEPRAAEGVLTVLEAARRDLQRRLKGAELPPDGNGAVTVVLHHTTAEFMAATGQPAWVAGTTRGRQIELQPIAVLHRRQVLVTTLRHEYAHSVIETLHRGRAPRWLAEGLAIHFAGEGVRLRRPGPNDPPPAELERRMARPASPAEMRELYAAAYHRVRRLIEQAGEAQVWLRGPNLRLSLNRRKLERST